MVTINDIRNKCFEVSARYGLGPDHTKAVMEVALLAIQHCQDKLDPVLRATNSPYVQPWGGHE